jgi:hypothetical protein
LDQGRWFDDEKLLAWLKGGNDKFRTEDALTVVGINEPRGWDRADMVKSLQQIGLVFKSTYLPGFAGRPKRWRQPKPSSV